MPLTLGKAFNRSHNMRVHFLDGFYDIGIFYNTKSYFVLFDIKPIASMTNNDCSTKIQMFKNIEASKFCQLFMNLHSYKSENLDIQNQVKKIKSNYDDTLIMNMNETITLARINLTSEKQVEDFINIQGYTLTDYTNEYLFLIVERCFIDRYDSKKIVRTGAIQLSTSNSFDFVESIYLTETGVLRPPVVVTYDQPPIVME